MKTVSNEKLCFSQRQLSLILLIINHVVKIQYGRNKKFFLYIKRKKERIQRTQWNAITFTRCIFIYEFRFVHLMVCVTFFCSYM